MEKTDNVVVPHERKRTGPHVKKITPPKGSEVSLDMTCGEFLIWYSRHSGEEAAEAFGMGRTAFFRRLKEIKKEENEDKTLRDIYPKRTYPA